MQENINNMTEEKFIHYVLCTICNYAKHNNYAITDTVKAMGENLVVMSEIASFDNWEEQEEYSNGQWIPADEPPKDNKYVLLSFANFPVPMVGRFEEDPDGGGAYYLGDEDVPLVLQDMIVNAWMPLPKPYNPDECMDSKPQTNADIIRSQTSTDEGLADFINQLDPNSDNFHYCIESTACDAYLERGELIPEGLCRQCLMEFLQREVEEHEQFT